MTDKPIYLTLEGKKKLEEELDHLVNVRRPEVAEAIRSAKEEGDLSENSAYDEAKLNQGFVEGRIQTIEAQLRNSVEEEGFGQETYQIVGSAEADPMNGKISNESPIGKALLGAKVGQTVTAETPGGQIAFKVIKIA